MAVHTHRDVSTLSHHELIYLANFQFMSCGGQVRLFLRSCPRSSRSGLDLVYIGGYLAKRKES